MEGKMLDLLSLPEVTIDKQARNKTKSVGYLSTIKSISLV
jgi:hypothetical protein